ncbi:hypothetical protein D3C87_1812050 [compost metagenome]
MTGITAGAITVAAGAAGTTGGATGVDAHPASAAAARTEANKRFRDMYRLSAQLKRGRL